VKPLPLGGPGAITINFVPQADDEDKSESKPAPTPPRPEQPQPVKPRARPVEPPKIKLPSKAEQPWIEISPQDFAAGDLHTLPKAGGGASAGDSEEVGRAPNGEILYAAEWARRPTNAELGGYLPRNAPDGWGMIACKTVPGLRVDECIELDQSPRGSHLAGAVRQAAWQFRVRPPRKNGVPRVGTWVRIRIDYTTVGG
jgi:protein TonB